MRLWTHDPISTLRESLAIVAGQWVRSSYPDAEAAIEALGFGGVDTSGGAREMRKMVRDLYTKPCAGWWRLERPPGIGGRDPVDVLVSVILRNGAQLPGVVGIMRDVFYFTQIAAAELELESEARARQLRIGKPLIT